MCGIFGYIGKKNPVDICIFGLKQLEYRGYDSAGIAGLWNQKIAFCKEAGKICSLEKKIRLQDLRLELAIGHTRWATHGEPTDINAHPHFDAESSIALVHNGIIENYSTLRSQLQQEGIRFASQTDTEVIVHLIAKFYRGNLTAALQQALALLKGSFAIALIHRNHPEQIFAAAKESPLCISFDDLRTEAIISSDPNALLETATNVLFLRNGEIARVHSDCIDVFDSKLEVIVKQHQRIETDFKLPSKEGFEHFMLKEIFEQPSTVQKTLFGRINEQAASVDFDRLGFSDQKLRNVRHIWLLGCGTSAHAGWIGALFFEDLVRVPCSVDIASEARYRNPILTPDTLVIAISQSGETADTLAAMRESKKRGCDVLGICNVKNSTLSREADETLFLQAGPEISVCSTKSFSSQIALLALFALHMARLRGMDQSALSGYFSELKKIPGYIQQVLEKSHELQRLAKKYAAFDDFFFMGRRYMVPTCLEASLKLKEVSYVNANSYPAGELKHGPIALLNPKFPVIAFCANRQTQDKIAGNLMEVKARGAPILAFASRDFEAAAAIADDVFWLPSTIDPFAPFASTIAGQLLAYYIAKERGCDIDQPRNLAKSVTVE